MSWFTRSIPDLAADLVEVEARINMLRCEQIVLVSELERAQAPQADGSRSLIDWVSAQLDMNRTTARDLVFASRRIADYRPLENRMVNGAASFDRTIAVVKLADAGASDDVIEASFDRDLDGVRRLTNRTKHVTPVSERDAHAGRFLTIQPNLDESTYRLTGEAPGIMGRTIEKAICDRSDELNRSAPESSSRGQRYMDALESLALDSLDKDPSHDTSEGMATGPSVPHVTVFVDARQDDAAETAAEIAYGPRVGPDALRELLCGARIQVVGLDADGIPVTTSRATRNIPSAVRHHVAHRDKACVIDGCVSSYRLQPHHVLEFAKGGSHEPDNLATVCWFHHHIVIHRKGFRIDPESPPLRRQLLHPESEPRPPPDWY